MLTNGIEGRFEEWRKPNELLETGQRTVNDSRGFVPQKTHTPFCQFAKQFRIGLEVGKSDLS